MKQKWNRLIVTLLMSILLEINVSCQVSQPSQMTLISSSTIVLPSVTSSPTQNPSPIKVSTLTPTIIATPSPTLFIQEVEVINVPILPKIPERVELSGVIVMSPKHGMVENHNLYLIEANTQDKLTYLPPYPYDDLMQIWGIGVSPDRKLLAYLVGIERSEHLYVVDVSGQTLVDLLIVDNENNFLLEHSPPRDGNLAISLYWLDNERLMTDMVQSETSKLTTVSETAILIEPFTGHSIEFPPIYPEIILDIWYLGWDFGHNTGMIFDPTAKWVLYARKDNRIALWDLEKDRETLLLPEKSVSEDGPVWRDDGSFFVADLYVGEEESRKFRPRDLFLYTYDGEVARLTYFGELFSDNYVYSPRFSPDGRKIAFVFGALEQTYCPQNDTNFFPAVIDLDNSDIVKIFCTGINYFSDPIWSPDGKQLIYFAENNDETLKFMNFVIDLETGLIFKLDSDDRTVGWMAE